MSYDPPCGPGGQVTLKLKLLKHGRNTADVVEVVMTHIKIVDMLDAELIEVGNGLCAIALLHIFTSIEQDNLSGRRDQNRPVSLANIHVVNLELTIGLALRDSA